MNLKFLSIYLTGLLLTNSSFATEGIQFFEDKVKPLFEEHCLKCHGEKKQKGGLRLDTVSGILSGGETEKLFIPGQPANSFIIDAVKRVDEDLAMPPKYDLPEKDIETLTNWIRMGAPMPRPQEKVQVKSEFNWNELTKFWSFQKPLKPNASGIDELVNKKLKEHNLKPVAKATKLELIRRATFDLTGLPPTPEEIDAFMGDNSKNAFEKVIERLLASKHYGERWGRFWLDVARYGDDQPYAFAQKKLSEAWKYRDWVVNAFNVDLPYNEFIRRQLAADLIPELAPEEYAATGLIATGPMYFKRTEVLKALADELDDRIDVVSKGFLGLTVACARCHDHKFDPIPTEDYYALAGVFKSTRIYDRMLATEEEIAEYHRRLYQNEILRHKQKEILIDNLKNTTGNLSQTLSSAVDAVQKGLLSDKVYQSKNLNPQEVKHWVKILKNKDTKNGLIRQLTDAVRNPNLDSTDFIELDDKSAIKSKGWIESTHYKNFVGKGYLHDGNSDKGAKSITFKLPVTENSKFELFLGYNSNTGRAKNVPVEIHHAGGVTKLSIDQSKEPSYKEKYVSLGLFSFKDPKSAKVLISNKGTSGYVIVDSIRMIPHGMKTNPDETLIQKRINELVGKINSLSQKTASLKSALPEFSTPLVSSKSPDHRSPVEVNIEGWKNIYLVIENKSLSDYKFHFSAWMNPVIESPKGHIKVTDLEPVNVDTDGKLYGAKYDSNEDAIICNGEVLAHGIQNHGNTVLSFRIPQGSNWKTFKAEGGIFNKNGGQESKNQAVFHVFKEDPSQWLQREKIINEITDLTNGFYLNSKSVNSLPEDAKNEYTDLSNDLKNATPKRPKVVHGLWDSEIRNVKVNVRGNPKKFGDEVQRGYLHILNNGKKINFENGSGRLELANLIASDNNPLTARVMVNRIWHHLFGRGIVTSPSNFGRLGDKPSNQQLLDWLAVDFMENNWSVKTMIRKVMLSDAYQRSSKSNSENEAVDGDNQYVWKQNMKRLDAESLRDSILAVSGRLSEQFGGPSQAAGFDNPSFTKRAIYARVSRTAPDSMRLTFDFPSPSNSSPKRNITTVPQQRLFYLNSSFIMDQAMSLTNHIKSIKQTPEERLNYTFKLLYGREPNEIEAKEMLPLFEDLKTIKLATQAMLISNEFSYID